MYLKGWLTVCLIAAVVWSGFIVVINMNRDMVYTGDNIRFSVDGSRYIVISPESEVEITAASDRFFALRKASGETVVAKPATAPIGWTKDSYFSSEPMTIPGGVWIVAVGSPEVQIVGNDLTVKQVVPAEIQTGNVNGGMAVGAMVMVIGLLIIWYREIFN